MGPRPDSSSSDEIEELHPISSSLLPKPSLITRLKAITRSLPASVPIGLQDDPLAAFSTHPQHLVLPDQDPWEDVIDSLFNRIIGASKSVVDLMVIIRRGEYGMDGFAEFIRACVEDLGITPVLLEMRVERVIQAMINL